MRLPIALLLSVTAVSCSTLKPPAAAPSAFLSASPALKAARKFSPFALAGGSAISSEQTIYIAPISLAHLRAPTKYLARENDTKKRLKAAAELAAEGRRLFITAFRKAIEARYRVCNSASKDGLTLQLAIVELNRNTFLGAVSQVGLRALPVPGLDLALNKPLRTTKGNIAIEGKLVRNRDGTVLYQFADNEQSKNSILPITDFQAYGQAHAALGEWAVQFEKVTSSQPGECVRDSLPLKLY